MADPPWQDSPPSSAIGAIVRHFITRREGNEIYRHLRRHWLPNQQVLYDNLPHDAVQAWADSHEMQTFASSMGRLIDPADPRCPRASKSAQQWSDYIHGASVIFCWLISLHDEVTVLLEPQKLSKHSAGDSSGTSFYSTVQEPIVTGRMGGRSVKWLHVVQPTVRGAANYTVVIRADKASAGSNGFGALMSHLHDKLVGKRGREKTRTTMDGYEVAAENFEVKSRHRTRARLPLGEKSHEDGKRGDKKRDKSREKSHEKSREMNREKRSERRNRDKGRGEKSHWEKSSEGKGREKYRGEKRSEEKYSGEKRSKGGHTHTRSSNRRNRVKQEDLASSTEKPRRKTRSHGKQEGTSPRSGSTHKHRHRHRHKKRHKSSHLIL